jgi:hypothetical protein
MAIPAVDAEQGINLDLIYSRKNAQVVTNLQQTCSNAVPTTCQQDVFALLVPSLLTSCQRLVVGRGYFAGLRVTKRNKATVLLTLTLLQTPTLTLILTLT